MVNQLAYRTPAQEAEGQRQAIFQRSFSSRDAPFNFHIYDWLMSKRRTDELLNVSSLA